MKSTIVRSDGFERKIIFVFAVILILFGAIGVIGVGAA